MESLTHEASPMFDQATLTDTCNATFLQESEAGVLRYALPDGRIVNAFGLAAALVNLSAKQVKALGLRTSGIYGPTGCTAKAACEAHHQARFREQMA